MDAHQVYLVDVFTADPLSGIPVAVLPEAGDLAPDRVRAVAGELGAETAVALAPATEADREGVVADPGPGPTALAGIAAFGGLADQDRIDPGSFALSTGESSTTVAVADDGRTWADVAEPETGPADADLETVADALGIDVASLADVGADLPLAVHRAGDGALLVAVNFLEHLGGLDPVPGALTALLDAVGVGRICAFTFDTVDRDATLHARVVDPDAPSSLATVAPADAVGTLAHVRRHGAIEDDGPFRVEAGRYEDRPADLHLEATDDGYRLGGRTVTALDGSIVVPEGDADEIIEV